MLKKITLTFLFSVSVATAADPYVTIGTNRFGFVFEDTTLSTNMQARIIDDWKVLITPWTNQSVSVELPTKEKLGELFFKNYIAGPDFESKISCRSYDIRFNQIPEIILAKQLTEAYKEAFLLQHKYASEFSQISGFVSSLQHDTLMTLPSNQISNIWYYHGIQTNIYEASAEQIKSELLDSFFFVPSVLSFAEQPPNFLTHPTAALWSLIPVKELNSLLSPVDYMPAIYVDGKWKIHPLIF